MSKQYPHIALFVETSNAYCRLLLRGVGDYIKNHTPWSIYLGERARNDLLPDWLQRWEGDGVIARVDSEEMAEVILRSNKPTVNVSQVDTVAKLPSIYIDEGAHGRFAVQHLLDRGFSQFAYCSVGGHTWSTPRCQGFVDAIEEEGFSCHIYKPTSSRVAWEDEQDEIVHWLKALPKPIGLLTAHDFRGRQVLDACRRTGLAVPEEIALIGIGDDEVLCDLAWPPMSSIDSNPRTAGYEAAALLDRLMQGEPMQGQRVLVQPNGVIARQSTDIMAIEDSDVAAAVRFIRERACIGINVDDILVHIPLIRQTLEHRFKKTMGRSLHAEIVRVRIERVKQLLKETELSMQVIAKKSGFKNPRYMSTVFKEKVRQTPGRYRTAAKKGETSG